MLTTSPNAATAAATTAMCSDTLIVETKRIERDQRLLRLTFDALAKQVSSGRVSFPDANSSAKMQESTVTPESSERTLAFDSLAKHVSGAHDSFSSEKSPAKMHHPTPGPAFLSCCCRDKVM